MAEQIKHITIVGGGTAGWMTANLLTIYLNPPGKPPSMKISLIESPNIKTVGVGEATVPGMPRAIRQMGIDEREFFRRCNATFKLGVDFINWNHDENGKATSYINPFNSGQYINGYNPAYFFQKFGRKAKGDLRATDIIEATTPTRDAIALKRGPRQIGQDNFTKPLSYAYHLDASRFAAFLQEIGVARGVEHIRDDVENVNLDERGFVKSLDLKERGEHPIELVIDCTGFRGLIVNQALGEPFIPYSKYLMNDRALAVQIPHKDPKDLLPCTQSTALGAGWVWRVPLQNRVGTGYVFSSAHRTDEEATAEFLKHLKLKEKDAQPRAIPIRVGRTARPFVKNCLAIGLSSGFIEPLESTAIHMIDMGVRWLFHYFPDMDFDPIVSERYNRVATELYDEVRDFIVLHYYLSNRTDSGYWIEARNDLEIPDRLRENVELWKHTVPTDMDLESSGFFTPWNYCVVLFGKGFYSEDHVFPSTGGLNEEDWNTYIRNHRAAKAQMLKALPSHYDLVQSIRGPERTTPSWVVQQAGTIPVPGQVAMPQAPVKNTEEFRTDEGALL